MAGALPSEWANDDEAGHPRNAVAEMRTDGYRVVMDKKRRKKSDIVPVGAAEDATGLLRDLRALIDAGRTHVARAVNAGMVLLYWSVGDRIRREIPQGEAGHLRRADCVNSVGTIGAPSTVAALADEIFSE